MWHVLVDMSSCCEVKRVSSGLRRCSTDAGSPFQLEMLDARPTSSVYFPLDSQRPLRIPLGRPALVGIERGRGPLYDLTPACLVTCKSAQPRSTVTSV